MANEVPVQQTEQLSNEQTKVMRIVASSWLDYFYRPLVFPHEYFKHFRPTRRYMIMKPVLPQMYQSAKEVFVLSCSNINTYRRFQELRQSPSDTTADAYLQQSVRFLRWCIENDSNLQKVHEAAQQLPLLGRAVSFVEMAASNEMKDKMGKVQTFINKLFMDKYLEWLDVVNKRMYTIDNKV